MSYPKLTPREFQELINDFLTEHELSLEHRDSGATISAMYTDDGFEVVFPGYSNLKEFRTLKGALNYASQTH